MELKAGETVTVIGRLTRVNPLHGVESFEVFVEPKQGADGRYVKNPLHGVERHKHYAVFLGMRTLNPLHGVESEYIAVAEV
jgi:uncharacterized protein (DUF2132 family)